jgi:hypothetical protein
VTRLTSARISALAAAAAVLVAASGGARAGMPAAQHDEGTVMVGNMAEYPSLARAGARNVRRARRLRRRSLAARSRFDTIAEARRLGYAFRVEPHRPGLTHMRKHGTRFWGRLFDARNPQALVFWCPVQGRCTLTTSMYRARPGRPPSTWGKLIQWHRHGIRATWMTHLWLLERTREAFATCAPLHALETSLGIHPVPYRHAIHALMPCSGD